MTASIQKGSIRLLSIFLVLTSFNTMAGQIVVSEQSQRTLVLGLTHIEGVMDVHDQNAPYNKLLSVLEQQYKLRFDTAFYPGGRSNYLLENSKIDCIFPIAKGIYRGEAETVYLEPVNRLSVHLFSYGKEAYSELNKMWRKTVVYPQGYLFGNLLNDNPYEVSFVPVVSQQSGIELIKKNRADAYMDYMPDLRLSVSDDIMKQLNYAQSSPIQSTSDSFECRAESENIAMIEDLNLAIKALKKSGQLKTILGKYYNL